jgi:MamI restriction endonuclease.
MDYSQIAKTILSKYQGEINQLSDLDSLFIELSKFISIDQLSIDDRISFSTTLLCGFSKPTRKLLTKKLIKEQIVGQRKTLGYWSSITAQSAMIDTGYIGQHLVSLQTQLSGQGMRGKGDDLIDGSEVKSANFLDSLDQKGASAPRWNFTANKVKIMERFLTYASIYLLSIDRSVSKLIRVRIWKVTIKEHHILSARYREWMTLKGYPKLQGSKKHSANFQLFPPRSETNDNFARHGNSQSNGFDKLEIPLENTPGSELIFHAEEKENGEISIIKF